LPRLPWAAQRALRAPRRPKAPEIAPNALCYVCRHPRSSHNPLVLHGRCRACDVGCAHFEPMCGCGHLLVEHEWSDRTRYWGCARCDCAGFGPAEFSI
jgi:hypothetical protein